MASCLLLSGSPIPLPAISSPTGEPPPLRSCLKVSCLKVVKRRHRVRDKWSVTVFIARESLWFEDVTIWMIESFWILFSFRHPWCLRFSHPPHHVIIRQDTCFPSRFGMLAIGWSQTWCFLYLLLRKMVLSQNIRWRELSSWLQHQVSTTEARNEFVGTCDL